MARTLTSFNKLLRLRSPKIIQNPNHQFRNTGNDGRHDDSQEDQLLNSSSIMKQICGRIRSKPRWEDSLMSDFPDVSLLLDSRFLNQVIIHQNNAFLSIRLLYWLISTHEGYSPPKSTCGLIFNALVEHKAAKAAKGFLDYTKYAPEVSGLESYVRCLCESGMVKDALQVFDEMKNKKTGVCPSLKTWNAVLLASMKDGRTDVVWKLYGEMMEREVVADVDTVGYLIQTFCKEKKVLKGYELLRQVLDDGFVPHKAVFNKLVFELLLDKKYDRVSMLLHIMIAKGIDPDLYTYRQIVHGMCIVGMHDEGLHTFNSLKDRGYAPDKIMYTIMIGGLCKAGRLGEATKLWFEMTQKGINPYQYTYNALLKGIFEFGKVEDATSLFKEMDGKGYAQTPVAYNIMINGLCSCGRAKEAFRLFKQMGEKGVSKNVMTYKSLIKGLCEEGKLDKKAMNLLDELVQQGFRRFSSSHGFLISRFYKSGRMVEVKTLQNKRSLKKRWKHMAWGPKNVSKARRPHTPRAAREHRVGKAVRLSHLFTKKRVGKAVRLSHLFTKKRVGKAVRLSHLFTKKRVGKAVRLSHLFTKKPR